MITLNYIIKSLLSYVKYMKLKFEDPIYQKKQFIGFFSILSFLSILCVIILPPNLTIVSIEENSLGSSYFVKGDIINRFQGVPSQDIFGIMTTMGLISSFSHVEFEIIRNSKIEQVYIENKGKKLDIKAFYSSKLFLLFYIIASFSTGTLLVLILYLLLNTRLKLYKESLIYFKPMISLTILLFSIAMVYGIAKPISMEEISTVLKEKEIVKQIQSHETSSFERVWLLFKNNFLFIATISFGAGILIFLPIGAIFNNAYVLGSVISDNSFNNIIESLILLLPHGIVEIPGAMLLLTLGFSFWLHMYIYPEKLNIGALIKLFILQMFSIFLSIWLLTLTGLISAEAIKTITQDNILGIAYVGAIIYLFWFLIFLRQIKTRKNEIKNEQSILSLIFFPEIKYAFQLCFLLLFAAAIFEVFLTPALFHLYLSLTSM